MFRKCKPSFAIMLTAAIGTALAACAISGASSGPTVPGSAVTVQSVAMMPGGGLLADAVAVELMNRGFSVVDPSQTTNLMVRLNMTEIEVSQPQGLARLRAEGIAALLMVRASGGYDGQPQSASARMTSTADGKLLAGVTWQNGFGGQAGSIADRVMRQGLSGAASEIANGLSRQVRPG